MTTERGPRDRRTRDGQKIDRQCIATCVTYDPGGTVHDAGCPYHLPFRSGSDRRASEGGAEKRCARCGNGIDTVEDCNCPEGFLSAQADATLLNRTLLAEDARHPEAALVAVGEAVGSTAPSGGSAGDDGLPKEWETGRWPCIEFGWMQEEGHDWETGYWIARWSEHPDIGLYGDGGSREYAVDDLLVATSTYLGAPSLTPAPTPPREPASAEGTLVERLADGWPIPLSEEEAYRLAKFALRTVADEMHAKGEHQVVHILRTEADR